MDEVLARRTRRGHALPTRVQVLLALRFYASGAFQNVVGDACHISQSSASRSITAVSSYMYGRAIRHVRMPRTMEEMNRQKIAFSRMYGFPRIIGLIDGSLIRIKGPSFNENAFVSRKLFHSINIQVVADANSSITSFDVKWPGSTHDSFIWINCTLRRRFVEGEFGESLLLG
jgi:hypothetical protein